MGSSLCERRTGACVPALPPRGVPKPDSPFARTAARIRHWCRRGSARVRDETPKEQEVSFLDSLGSLSEWPVLKQVANRDAKGLGGTAFSKRSVALVPRTETSQNVVKSICPYCGVGCGQNVYVSDGKI